MFACDVKKKSGDLTKKLQFNVRIKISCKILIRFFYLFKNISLTKLTVEIHFPEGRNSLKLGCRQDF